MGRASALEAMRKALAMGADRSLLVSDDGAAGSDLVATSRVLAAALERQGPDLVLFGQQASDSDGAVLWAAVADNLRRPLVSQAAELTVADGKVRVKRQTEFGYDVIEAPLPAVVAVSDAINEPRYPSLKGIMGAKSKPQETVSPADLGLDAAAVGRGRVTHGGVRGSATRPLGATAAPSRTTATRHRPIVDFLAEKKLHSHEHARLPRAPRQRALEGLARRPSKAATLGDGDVAGLVAGSGVRGIAAEAGRVRCGAASTSPTTRALAAPLPQPRVDVLAQVVRERGIDTVLFATSVLARRRRRRACRAARRRAQLGPDRPRREDAAARRQAPGAAGLRLRRRRLDVGAPARALPLRQLRPAATGGAAEVEDVAVELEDFSGAARMIDQAHEESEGPSIEDADVIVAGGRGLGGPENFALLEELARALGGAVGATRAVVDAGWYPYAAQVGQTGQDRHAEAVHRAAGSRARSSTRSACRAPA